MTYQVTNVNNEFNPQDPNAQQAAPEYGAPNYAAAPQAPSYGESDATSIAQPDAMPSLSAPSYGANSEAPAYGEPAAPTYTETVFEETTMYTQPSVSEPAAAPAYTEPAAATAATAAYGAPAYNQSAAQGYAAPEYGQSGYAQQTAYTQPAYTQQSYAQPQQPTQPQAGYAQTGYAQPGYAQPNYAQAGQYSATGEVLPAGYTPKSKIAAGLLSIFLGCFGVGNFYLGFTGKAVAQLLLTLLGWIVLGLGPIAASIWGLIEGIMILCSHPGQPAHRDAKGVELTD